MTLKLEDVRLRHYREKSHPDPAIAILVKELSRRVSNKETSLKVIAEAERGIADERAFVEEHDRSIAHLLTSLEKLGYERVEDMHPDQRIAFGIPPYDDPLAELLSRTTETRL